MTNAPTAYICKTCGAASPTGTGYRVATPSESLPWPGCPQPHIQDSPASFTTTSEGIIRMVPSIPTPTYIGGQLLDLGAFLIHSWNEDEDSPYAYITSQRIKNALRTFDNVAAQLDMTGYVDAGRTLENDRTQTLEDMSLMAEKAADQATWDPMEDAYSHHADMGQDLIEALGRIHAG